MVGFQTREQEKIIGLLHDCVAPHLVISQYQLELLMASLDENTLTETQQQMLIKSWRALTDGTNLMREVINASTEGANFDEARFFPTVAEALKTFQPHLEITLTPKKNPATLMAHQQLGLCLHELLTNILKHNEHKKASVTFKQTETHIKMEVTSILTEKINPTAHSTGLKRLKTRVHAWHGQFNLKQTHQHHKVEVSLPYKHGEHP